MIIHLQHLCTCKHRAAAAQNFADNQRRYSKEKTKKKVSQYPLIGTCIVILILQTKSVPPWVKEHPEVFDNAGFSLTMDTSQTSGSTMETSLQSPPPTFQVHSAGGWGYIPKEREEDEERMDIESRASKGWYCESSS